MQHLTTLRCPNQTTVPLTCWTTKVSYMQHLPTLSRCCITTVPLSMLDNQGSLTRALLSVSRCCIYRFLLHVGQPRVNYMQHLPTLSSVVDAANYRSSYMLDNQGKLYAASHHTKQCPNQTTVPPTCWTRKVN